MPIYNNTPSAGEEYADFVKDATALATDVGRGKVFYNNDGRQVGTAVIADCDLTGCLEFVPTNAITSGNAGSYAVNAHVGYHAKNGINAIAYPENGISKNGKMMTIRPSSIVAFKVNDDIIPCNITLTNGDAKLVKRIGLSLAYGDNIGCSFIVSMSNTAAYKNTWYLVTESDAMTIYYR